MERFPAKLVTAGAVLAALACGDGAAPERNEPGTGTSTLKVVADIEADDQPGGGFSTTFEVQVEDVAGNKVSGAMVAISNSQLGDLVLAETSVGSGTYRTTRATFPSGDFKLAVVRGQDNVKDVVVGGPAPHTITEPKANATVAANQPLVVKWQVPSRARGAWVETKDFTSPVLPDTGAYAVPVAENTARPDQRIRVFRFNEVDMAGGLPGSRMKVEVRHTVEPVRVQ